MVGRIAVVAGIAGTVAIVSGIVGVVALADADARADDAGSRISVAAIDVAAPAHPVAALTTKAAPSAPPALVTVPAPDPGEVGGAPATQTTRTTTDSTAAKESPPTRDAHRVSTLIGEVKDYATHHRHHRHTTTQSRHTSPARRD